MITFLQENRWKFWRFLAIHSPLLYCFRIIFCLRIRSSCKNEFESLSLYCIVQSNMHAYFVRLCTIIYVHDKYYKKIKLSTMNTVTNSVPIPTTVIGDLLLLQHAWTAGELAIPFNSTYLNYTTTNNNL